MGITMKRSAIFSSETKPCTDPCGDGQQYIPFLSHCSTCRNIKTLAKTHLGSTISSLHGVYSLLIVK